MAPPIPPYPRHYSRRNPRIPPPPRPQTQTNTMQQPLPDPTLFQNTWAILMRGRLRPIGDSLVNWLRHCPNQFWIQVEDAMERALRSHVPQFPPNTNFGRVVVNLTTDLAFVSPMMALTEGIPPLWRAPRAIIRTLLSTQETQTGTETIFEYNDAEALENLTSIISLESSLIFLPFLARDPTITVIEVHQRVLSFRLLVDHIPSALPQLPSYRVVLNPQLRNLQGNYRNHRHQNFPRRGRSQGQGHLLETHNILSMKILLWNCRGAGNQNFRRNFVELMRYHQPSIVVLVETRILGQRAETISTGLGFDSVVRSEAEGFSGGIWLLWDSDVVHLDVLSINHQVIHASVQVSSSPFSWLFSAVYASPLQASRLQLWDHLKSFATSHSLPWMLAGDFNEILSHNEKFSSSPANRNRISNFRNLLASRF